MGPLLQQGGARTYNRFSCWLAHWEGQAYSLYGVSIGMCSGFGLEGFAHLFGGVECRACSASCFCFQHRFCFWLFRNGSCGFFWSLCILCPECELTAHAHSYFRSHTVSLYFVAGGEVCPGTNNAHCSKGSQVPNCLIPRRETLHLILKG